MPVTLTVDILKKVCPFTSVVTLAQRLPVVQRALELAGADTPERAACMLAQTAYESAWYRAWVEEPSDRSGPHFENYEPPSHTAHNLGNTQPGDGARFIGRGLIQLTGRDNYTAAGAGLGLDLVGTPDLAADPNHAAQIAAWYWLRKGLNTLADAGDMETITHRINGGLGGYAERCAAWGRARAALGLAPATH